MWKDVRVRLALVTILVAAALVSTPRDWSTTGLAAIGIFCALVAVPGTGWARGFGTTCAFIGLLVPESRILMLLLVWLVVPPAFFVGWSFAEKKPATDDTTSRSRARLATAAIIGAVAVATVAYRIIFTEQLQQTAALFVGLPTILAIVVVLAVSPRSATGVAVKAVTVGLLISLVFLGEGMLCVVLSAPIFYGVGVSIGAVADAGRKYQQNGRLYSRLMLVFLLPMSVEGVTESLSFQRHERVTAEALVHASAREVERAVANVPRFDRPLPLLLQVGFPAPASARVDNGRWIIRMRGGEMRLDGMEPRAGDLVLELEESRPGLVRWHAVSDNSHMTHFLAWRSATVEWQPVDARTTRVTMTLQYDRKLDPAWYFGPMERHVARIAARYLIETVATP